MTNKISKKIYKFTKLFSVLLLIYSFYTLLVIISWLFFNDWVMKIISENSTNVILRDDILQRNIIVFTYCAIGGISLFKLKKWAIYFVTVIGVFTFGVAIIEFVMMLNLGKIEIPLAKIFLGISSLYILRNRSLFTK